MGRSVINPGNSRTRQIVKSILRFPLRYKWLVRFGQWVLKKQPRLAARLLGMADLTTPYMPPQPLIARNKKQSNKRVSEVARTNSKSNSDSRHQLLVDVSVIAYGDSKSGIQRVTRSLLRQLVTKPPESYRVEPVYRSAGSYRYARKFMSEFMGKPGEGLSDDPAEVSADDIFLGLDLTLDMEEADREWLRHQSGKGLKVFFVLHDLLPLVMPDCFLPQVSKINQKWLEGAVGLADGMICVSRSTAQELGKWLTLHPVERKSPLKIGYFHHGADIESRTPSRGLSKSDEKAVAQLAGRTSVLMVGTLEPRKGYTQALNAFEELWRSGEDVILIIVGKQGWKTEDLVKRLRKHPEAGRHLLWFDKASDELLLKMYKNTTVLLMASEGEGFGLPLIEAARAGRPVIARDLPVFHEVVGDQAFYFEGKSSRDLREALKRWLELYRKEEYPRSDSIKWQTWEQSADQLKQVIIDANWIATWDAENGFGWKENFHQP
jgi:glycosyltransferase involved in cell wall biosynthesis